MEKTFLVEWDEVWHVKKIVTINSEDATAADAYDHAVNSLDDGEQYEFDRIVDMSEFVKEL